MAKREESRITREEYEVINRVFERLNISVDDGENLTEATDIRTTEFNMYAPVVASILSRDAARGLLSENEKRAAEKFIGSLPELIQGAENVNLAGDDMRMFAHFANEYSKRKYSIA